MRSFLGTVLQSNLGEKDWVRVFESMNLTKKKNEVKNGWTKDKSVPVGDRDLGHFLGWLKLGMLPHLKRQNCWQPSHAGKCLKFWHFFKFEFPKKTHLNIQNPTARKPTEGQKPVKNHLF